MDVIVQLILSGADVCSISGPDFCLGSGRASGFGNRDAPGWGVGDGNSHGYGDGFGDDGKNVNALGNDDGWGDWRGYGGGDRFIGHGSGQGDGACGYPDRQSGKEAYLWKAL